MTDTPGTEPRFDPLIHPSPRISLVAILAAADWVDFAYLKEQLALSDSALSKHLSTLEAAGYVDTRRPSTGRRRSVRASLTTAGRAAFAGHVAALRGIINTAVDHDDAL